MDKIDLEDIINSNPLTSILSPVHKNRVKLLMIEAIHQALVLASENIKLITTSKAHDKGWPYLIVNQGSNREEGEDYIVGDKQSILDVEKLIIQL